MSPSRDSSAPSALSRTLSTPIGTLVRGRVEPRHSADEILRRADLPQSLATAINTILRRARLWRSERADVAAELAAHFRDGLDAGRTSEQLLRDFGNLTAAATLIRRAKRRNRPALWRAYAALWAAIGWGALALLAVYVFLFVRYLLLQPNVSRNYLAEINAPILAVPEADRAWPLYREAYLALTPLNDGSPAASELAGEGAPPRLVDALGAWDLPPDMLAQASDYLRLNTAALDTLRAATTRPALGLPVSDAWDLELLRHAQRLGLAPQTDLSNYRAVPSPNPWLVSIVSPELPQLRILARLLATDARLASDAGDADRAAADITAILAIADHIRSRRWLIADLVGLAIDALALDTACHLVTDDPDLLSDQQITGLAHAIGRIGAEGPLVRFEGERMMFDDTLQRLYSDDGRGNGVLTRPGVALFEHVSDDLGAPSPLATGDVGLDLAFGPLQSAVIADRASSRAMYNKFIDAVEARAAKPLWERLDDVSLDAMVEAVYRDPVQRARHPVVAIMVPALESAVRTADRTLLKRDAALTLLAVELHRRRTGAYPASLSLLAPTLLPITPRDRLTGDVLGYTLRDGRPVIYSRGADQDDDAGRPVDPDHPAFVRALNASFSPDNPLNALFNGRGHEPHWDGDWILWPPAEPDAQ